MAIKGTVALLTTRIDSVYNMTLWNGMSEGARSRNYRLITYRGGAITRDDSTRQLSRNVVYDNIDLDLIAGTLLVSSSISNDITPDEYETFCSRLRSKPIMSIGAAPSFVHRCLIDNSSGFYQLVTHIIRDHGCRSFAYLGGPKMGKEAIIRYEAFRRALADNGVTFNEELLAYANFSAEPARAATGEFIKKGLPFDALVAANDDMALAASALLQELGRRVPGDVKVVGFDDVPNALVASPPLSTVRQPLYHQGWRAMHMLLNLVEGGEVPWEEAIRTDMVIRKSCGCGSLDAAAKKARLVFRPAIAFGEEERAEIIAEVKRDMGRSTDENHLAAAGELVELFRQGLAGEGRPYMAKIQELVESVTELYEIDAWQDIMASVEKGFSTRLSEDAFPAYLALGEGREKTIGEKIMRMQSQKYAQSNDENRRLRTLLQGLGFSFRIGAIHDLMATMFKDLLGIASGYVLRFTDDACSMCRIVAGYDRDGKLDLSVPGDPFPARLLVRDSRHSLSEHPYIVCPITFEGRDFGLIVLEIATSSGYIYESVSSQLVSSIWGSSLLNESTEAAASLREWNRQIELEINPMLETIRQVGDITDGKLKTIAALTENSLASSKKISQTSDLIRGVSEKFTEMLEIINIIDGISTTVKIVSINASIEATHAGQFGRGFRVLAKEINKLSESTRQNAENIAETLRSVVDKIKISIEASRQSAATFQEQEKSVSEILGAMMTITEYMKHLDAGSNKILSVMEKK